MLENATTSFIVLLYCCYHPPPPPARMHEGAVCVFPFFLEKGGILALFTEKGVFWVIANGKQYPRYGYMYILFRDRGVQVMGNEHRHPWFYGCGRLAITTISTATTPVTCPTCTAWEKEGEKTSKRETHDPKQLKIGKRFHKTDMREW